MQTLKSHFSYKVTDTPCGNCNINKINQSNLIATRKTTRHKIACNIALINIVLSHVTKLQKLLIYKVTDCNLFEKVFGLSKRGRLFIGITTLNYTYE